MESNSLSNHVDLKHKCQPCWLKTQLKNMPIHYWRESVQTYDFPCPNFYFWPTKWIKTSRNVFLKVCKSNSEFLSSVSCLGWVRSAQIQRWAHLHWCQGGVVRPGANDKAWKLAAQTFLSWQQLLNIAWQAWKTLGGLWIFYGQCISSYSVLWSVWL